MTFLTSLAVLSISALLLGTACEKAKLPPLLGMLLVGIVLGPFVLNLIAPSILGISADLRQLALVVILLRGGLSLDLQELKKNGRSAILMCFVPALFEIGAYILFGTLLLKLELLDAAILGAVMAAVSPAVVVPRMLKIKDAGYGTEKGIPQMILAGASVDDVFVIVLFTALTAMATGNGFSLNIVWQIPVSIILGIVVGAVVGYLLSLFFKRFHIRDSIKVIILLCCSVLFIALQNFVDKWVPFAALLSVISMGLIIFRTHKICAERLSKKFEKLWIVAEILLFVLVGAIVDIKFALSAAGIIIAVVALAMVFRMLGVYVCMLGSKLNQKERLFCMIAYSPKATVQAAIGAIPLSLGLASGQIILAAAVIAILITAPLGALLTDISYKKLLQKKIACLDKNSID